MKLILVILALLALSVTGYPSHVLKDLAYGQWAPPGPGDARGPCPGLNTLANHGFLPRNGQNITLSNLTSALENVYNMSIVLANTLAEGAILVDGESGTLSLSELDNHATIEHDASMTRNDFFFGDNHSLNTTLLAGLLASSSDGSVLTEDDFAYWQSVRQNSSSAANPNYTFGFKQQTLASGEPALVLAIFGTSDDNGYYSIPISSVKSIFALERIPDGWVSAEGTVGTIEIAALSKDISSKWTS